MLCGLWVAVTGAVFVLTGGFVSQLSVCLFCEVLVLKDEGLELKHKCWLWFPPQFYNKFISLDVDPSPCEQGQSFQALMKASCVKTFKLSVKFITLQECRELN